LWYTRRSIVFQRILLCQNTCLQKLIEGLPDKQLVSQLPVERLDTADLPRIPRLETAGEELLKTSMYQLSLSARAFDRTLKVSRAIADLAGSETIRPEHAGEAIPYRGLDRNLIV
jgi:predicted ATPase with chaperone activity